MKTTAKLGTIQNPAIIIDPELDKYDNVVLFPKKMEKAKATLARIGIPNKSNHSIEETN